MEVEERKLRRELDALGPAEYKEIFVEIASLYEIMDIEGKLSQNSFTRFGSSARTIDSGKEYSFSSPSLYPGEYEEVREFPLHDYLFLIKILKALRNNIESGEITLRSFKRKVFIFNNEGLKEKEEGFISVKIKKGDVVLRSVSAEKTPSWEFLANEFAARLDERKKARPLPVSGEMKFLMEGSAASVFVHEVLWHPLELDYVLEDKSPFSTSDLGREVFSREVTMYSLGPGVDDEGNEFSTQLIIENGRIVRFPSTRFTSLVSELPLVPHARREKYFHPPLVRPYFTAVIPGKESYLDLLPKIKRGAYVTEISEGELDVENNWAIFKVSKGFWVENGRAKYPLKPFILIVPIPLQEGEIFIGAEDFSEEGLFCHKEEQVIRYSSRNPNFLVVGYGKTI